MLRAALARRAAGGTDRGAALIAVVVLSAVILLGLATALTGASSGFLQATVAQSSARALDAAYAGVQDYIAKLNADSTYPQYGESTAAFSASSRLKLPVTPNPAFGVGTGGTWATVPGSTSGATFRYEVDTSLYGPSGLLRVRATGRFGTFTKTIVANIQQQGFINYLYFTNFEAQDPLLTGTSAACDRYLWGTPSRDTTKCAVIQFGARDQLQGPVRSNDTITACGATFSGSVTSSNPQAPIVATPSSCASTTSFNGGTPSYAPVLPMPETNSAMRAQTYSDVAVNPGCLYTGPTQITLNSNGTMTVVSPWTRATVVTSKGLTGTVSAACGSLSGLHSIQGATVPVPANNLVYVQSVPIATADVNYTPASATTTTTTSASCGATYSLNYGSACSTSTGATCTSTLYLGNKCVVLTTKVTGVTGGAVPSSVTMGASWPTGATYTCTGADGSATPTSASSGSAGWIFKDPVGTVRFPLVGESPATNWRTGTSWSTTTPAYGCRNGDVFVSGALSGQLTIASDNYVYATGNITYGTPSSDVLGLVGNNGVLIWNPMSGSTPLLAQQDRRVDAAILSPVHTFQVQNYDVGGYRGVLTINGSIAQRFRGPVATTSGSTVATGYAKNYGYDQRFGTVTPPYYLKPTSASFRVSSYASTRPAYASTGAASP